MTLNSISKQLELDFSCTSPIYTEVAPTTASVPQNPPCLDASCTHPRLSLGLDRAHCPDCSSEFYPWSKDYKNALQQPKPASASQEYKVGDRVTLLEQSHAEYEIIKISGGHATVRSVGTAIPDHNLNNRRVPFWQIRGIVNPPPEGGSGGEASPPDTPQQPVEVVRGDESASDRPPEHLDDQLPHDRPPEHLLIESRDRKHTPASGWIEKYPVKHGKYHYYRYCWQMGHKGKVTKIHIPSDSGKLSAVRQAISAGLKPDEISQILKKSSGGRDV